MIRPAPSKLKNLLLALALAAQASFAAAADQKGSGGPRLPQLGITAAIVTGPQTPLLPAGEKQLALPGGPALALPAFTTPNPPKTFAAAAIPAAAQPQAATPAAAAASLAGKAEAIAPQLEAASAPAATASGSAEAGRAIQSVLEGGRPVAASASAVDAAAASGSAGAPLAASTSDGSSKGGRSGPPAPPAPPSGPEAQRKAYQAARAALAALAVNHGVVATLPMMQPALADAIKHEAAYKDAVLADIDDTVTSWNSVLPAENAARIEKVLAAGKLYAAITDRPDETSRDASGKVRTLSGLESFDSVAKDKRAGMIVATNVGGKVYEADANGDFKLIHEEPGFSEMESRFIDEAIAVVLEQMKKDGIPLQRIDKRPHSVGVLFDFPSDPSAPRPGKADALRLAALLETELRARGVQYAVMGREAKDPTKNPPYLNIAKLDKASAVRAIARLKGLKAEDTLVLGDSMFVGAKPAGAPAEALAEAERLSGKPAAEGGNETDRNMEKGLPGAMALSVGGTADPRMANAWVMPVEIGADGKAHGVPVTMQILDVVAARQRGERPPKPAAKADEDAQTPWERAGAILMVIALLAAAAVGYYMMFSAFNDVLVNPPQQQYEDLPPGFDPNFDLNDIFR